MPSHTRKSTRSIFKLDFMEKMLLFLLDGCVTISNVLRNRRYDRSMNAASTIASREFANFFFLSPFFPSIYHFYHAEAVTLADRKKYAGTDDSCYDFFFLPPSARFPWPGVPSDCPCPPFAVLAPPCHPSRCGSFNLHRRLFAARSQRLFTDVARKAKFFVARLAHETTENCSFLSFFASLLSLYVSSIKFENRQKQFSAISDSPEYLLSSFHSFGFCDF